jgi:hypothetical protein
MADVLLELNGSKLSCRVSFYSEFAITGVARANGIAPFDGGVEQPGGLKASAQLQSKTELVTCVRKSGIKSPSYRSSVFQFHVVLRRGCA